MAARRGKYRIQDSIGWWIVFAGGIWWAICILELIWYFSGSPRSSLTMLGVLYSGLTVFLSPVCLFLHGLDKQRAQTMGRRIPERVLLTIALCGGWPGNALGRHLFRHKTLKFGFRLASLMIVLGHAIVILLGSFFLRHA